MGGRGASSGTSNAGNKYGTQYKTLLTSGNISFVSKVNQHSETLMETATKGRVYALIDRGKVKSIIYNDKNNKRSKQIDLNDHGGLTPHVHRGYFHNEYTSKNQPTKLTTEEKSMVERVTNIWNNHKSKQ